MPAANGDFALTGSHSEPMRVLERTMARIAPTSLPILLVGECGTGKAFLAHQIHQLSLRRDEPLARVICSGLAADGVAGHFSVPNGKKGNGAAGRGTLFLKEISELSGASQRSLLYSIPEGDGGPGGEFEGPRLISSTRVDLEEEVSAGRFRSELYYRLKGACLHLPALRERKEDVPELAELLLSKHAKLQGRPRPSLDAEDLALLQQWSWPGNIRELENVIKQVVILNDPKGVLLELLADPKESRAPAAPANGLALKAATRAASRRVEEQLILDALTKTRWNRKRAAQDLQISYKSLLSKLKQIGGDKPGKS
jgi:two-component system response regulator AtoC